MRILYIHQNFGAWGGAEANIYTTAAELKNRGHQVELAYEKGTGRNLEKWNDVFSTRFQYADLYDSSIEDVANVDLIYIHKCSDLKVLKSLKETRIPKMRMVHDHELYCMRNYKYNYWTRHVCDKPLSLFCVLPCGACIGRSRDGFFPLRWVSYFNKKTELNLSRENDLYVVASEFMKLELVKNGFNDEKIVILPPVPASIQKRTVSHSPQNTILYVGQITRGKGVDLLIQALAMLQTRFQCFIVGEGNYRDVCEKLVQKFGLQDSVTFTGFLDTDEIQKYYRSANLLVVSSIWPEPFGMVGLEAMSHGIPVVAFDVGGIQEWLRHGYNGFLCRQHTPECLAANIRKLLTHREMAEEMGNQGRLLLEEKFCFSKYMNHLEGLMEEILEKVTA
jgi:glycosyltransferase involved in cell wall biosynthesis